MIFCHGVKRHWPELLSMTHEQELLVAGVCKAFGECTDTVSKFWSRRKVAEV